MSKVSRKEFNEAVVAVFKTVRSFHGQLALMYEQLKDDLKIGPGAMKQLGNTHLWRPKGTDVIRICDDYRSVFQPTGADEYDDELDDVDDGGEDDNESEEKPTSRKKQGPIEIAPQQPLLAVRIVLRDQRQTTAVEPQLLYATLSDWGIGDADQRPDPDDSIRIKTYMFRRIPKVLKKDLSEQQRKRVATSGSATGTSKTKKRGRLFCTITSPVHCCALFDLEGPDAVEKLAVHMKSLVNSTDGNAIPSD